MSKPIDLNLASPCGSYCGECKYYKDKCSGCGHIGGKPFWGECPVYACVRERGEEHCGVCTEFPCDRFLSTFDPAEGQWRAMYRAGQLAYRKRIGTRAWLEGKASGKNPDPKSKR